MVLSMAARRRAAGHAGVRPRPRPTTPTTGLQGGLGTTVSPPISLAQNRSPTRWQRGATVAVLSTLMSAKDLPRSPLSAHRVVRADPDHCSGFLPLSTSTHALIVAEVVPFVRAERLLRR